MSLWSEEEELEEEEEEGCVSLSTDEPWLAAVSLLMGTVDNKATPT